MEFLGMSLRARNKSEITLPLNGKKMILCKQNIIQIHVLKDQHTMDESFIKHLPLLSLAKALKKF